MSWRDTSDWPTVILAGTTITVRVPKQLEVDPSETCNDTLATSMTLEGAPAFVTESSSAWSDDPTNYWAVVIAPGNLVTDCGEFNFIVRVSGEGHTDKENAIKLIVRSDC